VFGGGATGGSRRNWRSLTEDEELYERSDQEDDRQLTEEQALGEGQG
jgi:hypothetical protein